jgi:hypothetical protein
MPSPPVTQMEQQFPDLRDLVGVVGYPVLGFSSCSSAASSLTCPFPPRSHLPSMAIAVSNSPGRRHGPQPASDDRIQRGRAQRLDHGADPLLAGSGDLPRSGCDFPSSAANRSCGKSAAWSPISRKFFVPASTHTNAIASMSTSVNRWPHFRRASPA